MMHGAIYLIMKTEGRLFAKLTILLRRAITFFIISFSITSLYTLIYIPHLSDAFTENVALIIVPILVFISIATIPNLVRKRKYQIAFLFSSITVSLLLILVAVELYPVLIISTIAPEYNMTIYNTSSSDKSLGIMLIFAAIGIPLVAAYTFFVYRTFYGKVTLDDSSY